MDHSTDPVPLQRHGAKALRIGPVSRIGAIRATVIDEALALAQRIATRSAAASAYAKEAMRSALELELTAGPQLEKSLFSLSMNAQERAEAALAFREKHAPRFARI